jgi:hypothetical protein
MISSCTDENKNQAAPLNNGTSQIDTENPKDTVSDDQLIESLSDFLPNGYIIFDTIYGDLNNDGKEDCVLITKGTDKTEIVQDEYRGELDRNRRGLIVLLNKNSGYELFIQNENCFSSENEDGGVYFAPELFIIIEKGKLFIHYAHGRYGYWKYTFRIKQNDLELIGYDQSDNRGPIVSRVESINFLTKKKLIKENVNIDTEEPENEVFKETWEDIQVDQLLKLSKVEDFDNADFLEN